MSEGPRKPPRPYDHIPPRSRGEVEHEAERSYVFRQVVLPAQRFIHTEVLGGIALLIAAVVALIWANSPLDEAYFDLFATELSIDAGIFHIEEDLHGWINDGLMTLFFFVVGLEIKREMTRGELAGFQKAMLPVTAALGGMIVPAAIYIALNAGGDGASGWGIPMATDIAFALGILALVGRRIPAQLRVFLLALAIADDIGAITVIAVFYTSDLSIEWLLIAGAILAFIHGMSRAGVRDISVYLLVGVFAWVAMFESGVHPTIAGVVLGLMTPANPYYSPSTFEDSMENLFSKYREAHARNDEPAAQNLLGQMEALTQGTESPLERLQRLLLPITSFIVVPLFALANAGVVITGDSVSHAVSSDISQGVAFGLVLGKPVGIFLAAWLAVRVGLTSLPPSMNWWHILGVGLLGGIGFTVSLFVNELAFDEVILINDGKMGILAASLVAAVMGYVVLILVTRNPGGSQGADEERSLGADPG
jgi:NhaA family Na+:H+ antiporter